MMYIVAIALLLLTAAVVFLFAMMGELASRTGNGQEPDWLRPVDGWRDDVTTADWPRELAALEDEPASALLVLSPICNTCDQIARSLVASPPRSPIGLVISSNGRDSGHEFITRHGLGSFPHFVDDNGAWTTTTVGVKGSPTALLFYGGKITAAYTFSKTASVLQLLDSDTSTEELV
jgi:hypothetical protein